MKLTMTKKKKFLINSLFILLLYACSCTSNTKHLPAESNIDCLKKFVEASLKGNREEASAYMIQDSLNITLLNDWHKKYIELPQDEQRKYAQANVIVLKDSTLNDSTVLFHYYNSYKKKPTQIKVCYTGLIYLVDIKHTFYENQ